MIRIEAIVLVAFSLVAAAPPPSDDEMRDRIEEEMAEEDLIDVKVSVKDRAVTLSGSVPSTSAAKRAVDRAVYAAEDADETAKVVSRLTVFDSPADDALQQAVAASLGALGGVEVEARSGVVTLRGTVADAEKAKDLVDRAGRVPGVQDVRNEIEVLSPGALDDDLRLRIQAAIYQDAAFSRYDSAAHRPIQVAVERGRVVLAGVVSTALEHAKAEALARAVPGHFGVENRLRIEK